MNANHYFKIFLLRAIEQSRNGYVKGLSQSKRTILLLILAPSCCTYWNRYNIFTIDIIYALLLRLLWLEIYWTAGLLSSRTFRKGNKNYHKYWIANIFRKQLIAFICIYNHKTHGPLSIFKRQYIKTKTPECQTLRCVYKNILTTNVYKLFVYIVCDFM